MPAKTRILRQAAAWIVCTPRYDLRHQVRLRTTSASRQTMCIRASRGEVRGALYGGGEHDRHNNARIDEAYVEGMLRHPSARYVLLDEQLRLFLTDDGLPRWFSSFDALSLVKRSDDAPPVLFLGVDAGGAPLCAIRLRNAEKFEEARFVSLRDVAGMLPKQAVALAAHARSLFAFHDTHAFCGSCGSPTRSEHGGARRKCVRAGSDAEGRTQCRGTWYPRVDPAVIMLIVHPSGERVLLARQARYPKGMYSCLAGHMEHGEAVEDAVRRETVEESGVSVGQVRFFASQPWPFPYTLMLACAVQATSEEMKIDHNELEDATWVSRDDLAAMVAARDDAMRVLRRQRNRSSRTQKDNDKNEVVVEDGEGSEDDDDVVLKFVPSANAIAGMLIEAYLARDKIFNFAPIVTEDSAPPVEAVKATQL